MSRFVKIFVAMAAMSALAAPAFAITADMTGFLQVRGFAWDNTVDGNDDADDNGRGTDQRFRLWTNAALNENVKAVFGLEVDTVWGQKAGAGDMGADEKDIEIKHAYLDFNIPEISTNVKAGVQTFKLGGGFIINDDATGLLTRFTPVEGQSVLLAWVKSREGDDVIDTTTDPDTLVNDAETDDEDDEDYYHLQYDMKLGGWAVSPFVGYLNAADSKDTYAYFVGADVAGKLGPVTLGASVVGNDWNADDIDGRGLAVLVKGAYKIDALTLNAEAAYYGDDDTPDGQFVTLSQGGATGMYNNFSEIITGGRFDVRGNLNSTWRGSAAPYYANYMYGKVGADFKINDKNTVSAAYIYSKEAEEGTDAADNDITFGHEVDAYYDLAVVPGVTFTVGGGYLLADDDFGAGDDAWKAGTAVTYKF